MRFIHPDHPGRRVRLAYCTNLHTGETLEEIRSGLETFTLALKNSLGVHGVFGVGLYLPAKAAYALSGYDGEDQLTEWARFFEANGLDPFTFNAFPYGGFQRDGLKAGVYEPTWMDPERGRYTGAVAQVATEWQSRLPFAGSGAHISISTHPGAHESQVDGTAGVHACSRGLAAGILALGMTAVEGTPPVVLSVEAEPYAIAGDSAALAEYLVVVGVRARRLLQEQGGLSETGALELVGRHLGTCLDACHSAVEFETVERALTLAQSQGPIGKLQYSNALRVVAPGENPDAVAALLALDEPRFLHQVQGRHESGFLRAADLPDLKEALAQDPARAEWLACDEWRCHFHVPVDMPGFAGLDTTQAYADRTLSALLRDPDTWRTQDLHVEIETYTWDVLPTANQARPRTEGEILSGIRAEYEHVLGLLDRGGWSYSG